MKKIAIFDLDGTLLNTIADLGASCNVILSRHNLPQFTLEDYERFVGNGMMRLVERALPEHLRTTEFVAQLRSEFVEHYTENISIYTTIYPDIEWLLEQLQSRNIALAVASNKFDLGTRKLIAHFFPQIKFAAVVGQRPNVALKPDPQIIYDIIDITHFEREDILYIGDSGIDIETAKAAGVESVGVTWGFRPRTELEACDADHIVDDAQKILNLI